jgi:hypothetical protein
MVSTAKGREEVRSHVIRVAGLLQRRVRRNAS